MILGTLLALALSLQADAAEISLTEKGHAYNPSWSPDGQWLAFELNKFEGSVDLFVVKVQNGTPIGAPQKVTVPGAGSNFSSGGSIAAAPNWHPQGQLIFEGSNAGGTNRLYFWAPGGQKASELLNTTQIMGDLSWPAVSPDGKMLAFVSDATGQGDLYTWNRSTNQVSQALSSAFSEMAPRYSKDGQKVAYSRKNQGGEDLFIWQTGQSIPRVGGNGDQTRPTWIGDSVVFFSNERGDDHWDIALSAGPGDKKVLAKDVRLPLRATPSVSPDGRWVIYGVSNPEKARFVMMTSADGARTIQVDTQMVAAGEPALADVGGRLYLAFTALPAESADWRALHIMDITELVK